MCIIKKHSITLHRKINDLEIVLRPLSDEHFPYLYKWNADPDVLYWCEYDDVEAYSPEMVRQIYGIVSQNAFCFIVEVNGIFIGECWLQKMNLPNVTAMYPEGTDIRRIDMVIGEKDYWGRGLGTRFIKMLIDYAFTTEKADVLHCFSEDYNIRSRRVWEKNGFKKILTEDIANSAKAKQQYHWRLTKEDYQVLLTKIVQPSEMMR